MAYAYGLNRHVGLKKFLQGLRQVPHRAGGRLLDEEIALFAVLKSEQYQAYASGSGSRNLVISAAVTVIGLPSLICLMNRGITEPREHITLP